MEIKKDRASFSRICQNTEPFRAWLSLAAVVYSNIMLNMSTSFGVLYDDLVEKYDSSRAGVGWILTIRWIFIFGTG